MVEGSESGRLYDVIAVGPYSKPRVGAAAPALAEAAGELHDAVTTSRGIGIQAVAPAGGQGLGGS